MFCRKIIYLSLFSVLGLSVSAQRKFSLEQCVDYAYTQSFDIKQRVLKIRQSENILRQSKQAIYPNANASLSQGISSGRSIDPFTNDFIQHTVSSNSIGLGTNLTIFNGFVLRNQIVQNAVHIALDRKK